MSTPGRVGSYEIVEKLGSGGMGTVYRAQHVETGRVVALKVMRQDLAEDSTYIRRFKREAQIAASVQSPNVVEVLEAGEEDGIPYIAMELVDGEPLSALLKSGPLLPEQALDVATQTAQGLRAAFDQGVIHRDISPQNVLVMHNGIIKIGDFGIARSRNFGTLTATGMFIGKPSYAAPEAFSGRTDTRSDIYSLGIVLFEMLSGRPPFLAPSPLATMEMHVNQAPPRLADLGVRVAPAVQLIISKCLAKDPRERYQSPRELVAALTSTVEEPHQTTSPARQTLASTVNGGRRTPLLFGIAGGAAVAALAVVGLVIGMSSGGSSESPTPTQVVGQTGVPSVSGAPSISPVAPTAEAPSNLYVVQPGDTASSIAASLGVPLEDLMLENCLDNSARGPDSLQVGDGLLRPGASAAVPVEETSYRVTGRVYLEGETVGYTAPGDAQVGIPGIMVCTLGASPRSSRTDADGFFQISDLQPGEYLVVLNGNGGGFSVQLTASEPALELNFPLDDGCSWSDPRGIEASLFREASDPFKVAALAAVNCANRTFLGAVNCGCTDPLDIGWAGKALSDYTQLIESGAFSIREPVTSAFAGYEVLVDDENHRSAQIDTCEAWRTESGEIKYFDETYTVVRRPGWLWVVSDNTYQETSSC